MKEKILIKEKGITLIALVITIVILIILATVAINVVFSENGLIKQAQLAKNMTENSTSKEREDIDKLEQELANLMAGDNEISFPGDITPPVVTVKAGTITSSNITVNVETVDSESGMVEEPQYTYYIKKTGEEDTSYQAKATDVTSGSYTFIGLTQETSYDIKVEVNGDNAGNIGIGILTEQVTTKVPGGGTEGEEGAITFGNTNWLGNGTASITVNTNTEMQIQYQLNRISGSWTDISNGGTVTNLEHNNTVYARLTDGTNYGEYSSASIVDEIAPSASISVGTKTENSIKISVNASDGQSGLATSGTYKYYLNGTLKNPQTSNSYTYTGLSAGTSYTIKVVVTDKAGNEKTVTTSASTEKAGVSAGEVTKNPSAYYGSEVRGYTCSSSGVSKWRIFYADSTNIYLIADDYISYQYAPNGKDGSSIYKNNTDYRVSFNNVYKDYYPGGTWINSNSKGRKWLNKYLSSYLTSTNNNIRAVAYMMDTNVWSVYSGADAEYAMGGPTLEMFCESYKQTHPSKYIEYQVNSTGYQVKWNTDSSYDSSIGGLPQNDFNNIYINSSTSKAYAMWLSSPWGGNTNYLAIAYYTGDVDYSIYDGIDSGLRPIVCLKSNTQLNKVSNGVYEIVK